MGESILSTRLRTFYTNSASKYEMKKIIFLHVFHCSHFTLDSPDLIGQVFPPARHVGEEDNWGALDEDYHSDRIVWFCIYCVYFAYFVILDKR